MSGRDADSPPSEPSGQADSASHPGPTDQSGRSTPRRGLGSGPATDARVLIEANGVGKRFTRFNRRATSIKERLIKRDQGDRDDFWALRDVTVAVRQGETVGLMGPNGSGKSTLLKVLSGILRASEGSVQITGRVASLLELGAGFDGELTGRENVYLNSALLGVPTAETDALYEKIVAFSELGEFIDTPVKHYSSGMYVRLGFAVAVHIDPDILIVDEVLAVGDAAFQKKCLDRIREFQQAGKTILFVSHSPGLIEALCTRAVLLSHGRVVFDGSPREGGDHLNALMGVDRVARADVGVAKIAAVVLVDPSVMQTPEAFSAGGSAELMADIDWFPMSQDLDEPIVAELAFLTSTGEPAVIVSPEPFVVPSDEVRPNERSSLRWRIPALPEITGDVVLRLSLRSGDAMLATADISGIRVPGTEVLAVDGHARFLTAAERAPVPVDRAGTPPDGLPTEPVHQGAEV